MNLKKISSIAIIFLNLTACANNKVFDKEKIEREYYSSSGFVLIYEENLYKEKIVNKKINNENLLTMHNSLKRNTPIRITNPSNSKTIETTVHKKADYPKIFNIVISKKIADLLELDIEDPFVVLDEIKKNKTFVAKEGSIFEEEKNVAGKAPVDKVEMNVITTTKKKIIKKLVKKNNFVIVISDFYYYESAFNLKNELSRKINLTNIMVKKINDNKYRLLVGPFKNFNALKTTYISLNNLGFESLNIYKE